MTYNEKIAKLAGLFTALTKEIEGDETLQNGEKFLLLQRLFADVEVANKYQKNLEKSIKEIAFEQLSDDGTGKSEEKEFMGASVFIKYSYPKPSLDADKLLKDLERAYADLNVDIDKSLYLKQSTPRKKVIIQSTLDK